MFISCQKLLVQLKCDCQMNIEWNGWAIMNSKGLVSFGNLFLKQRSLNGLTQTMIICFP